MAVGAGKAVDERLIDVAADGGGEVGLRSVVGAPVAGMVEEGDRHVRIEQSGAADIDGDVVGVPGRGSGSVDTGGVEAGSDFGEAKISMDVAESFERGSGSGIAEGDERAEVIAGDAGDLSGDGAAGAGLSAKLRKSGENAGEEKKQADGGACWEPVVHLKCSAIRVRALGPTLPQKGASRTGHQCRLVWNS